MQYRKTLYVLMGLMVLGSIIPLIPSASAQNTSTLVVTIPPTDQKVKPLQGIITIPGSYALTWSQDAANQVSGIPVTIKVTKSPAWVSAVASPASAVVPTGGTPGAGTTQTTTQSFQIAVTATQDAPAFTPDTIEVTVSTVPSNTQANAPKTTVATVQVTADYFSVLDVQVPESIKTARPQETVQFPVKLTNFGNANTKVSFTPGDHEAALIVQTPVPIILQSKQTGGNVISQDVQLTMQTPYKNGYMNAVGGVSFKITSAYALDPKLVGDSSAVSVVVTTKGFYVPGVEPVFVIGLIVLSALVLRRVRA